MSDLGKRLGKQLAERRKLLRLTQAAVAEQLGVDVESVSRSERGISLPSLQTLNRWADVVETPIAVLLSSAATNRHDSMHQISSMLDELNESDRVLVLSLVQQLCTRLKSD